MAETLLTIREELEDGGLSRLGTPTLNRLINDAYGWVFTRALWPFREGITDPFDASPPPGTSVVNAAAVSSVTDASNGHHQLTYMDRATLEERYGDLTTTGVPNFFYFDQTFLNVYPVGGSLVVRFWRAAPLLDSDDDTILVPDPWAQIVIDRARYRGLLRLSDWAGASALKAEIKDELDDMVADLLVTQTANAETIVIYGGEGS